MDPVQLSVLVKRMARELGFERCGVAPAKAINRAGYFRDWLAAGRAGSMHYLHQHLDQRLNPALLLDGARSMIVVALSYHQRTSEPQAEGHPGLPGACAGMPPNGRIAMYAWGEDYHVVVKDKLFALMGRLRAELPDPFQYRVCVDTSPILEREVAAMAGVGWIGKNTLVLHQEIGSYFFIGVVISTLDLALDEPVENHCGTCTACLDACPTQAFPAAYEMDASRCISYLTIEHRGDIAPELAVNMGDWIFGCDVCQEVCPFNRHAPETREPRFAARPPAPEISPDEVLAWTRDDYRRTLRGTAMKRAKLEMWKRNSTIVECNHGHTP